MSVTKAAQMMGVGRPALSNLLNARASLSPEMAIRLEKTFGASSQALLDLQSKFNNEQARIQSAQIAVRPYSSAFLTVKAFELEAWAKKLEARSHLPALIRRLVQTSGANLTRFEFPAYDNAQQPGWDGQLESETATPWIPIGRSAWELGTSHDVRRKADQDYATRVNGTPLSERRDMTFVFVTPRIWPGKEDWENTRRAENNWKTVRVLDAIDLELWLEQSVPTQAWIAEQLGRSSTDVLSLDECWHIWSRVTEPELTRELFAKAVETHKDKLERWLKEPPVRPFAITAASEEEALAFVSCLFESAGGTPGKLYNNAVVLKSPEALRKATRASNTFMPIIASSDAEMISAGVHKERHTVVVRRKTSSENDEEINLNILDSETFRKGIVAMGLTDDDSKRLALESGMSLTVLRRRLAKHFPDIQTPPWAAASQRNKNLIPIALAGVWNSDIPADKEVMKVLTEQSDYEDIERNIADLLATAQTPVWRVGRFRGVLSKIDIMYALRDQIVKSDLDNFFTVALTVLSEKDPALELPEDKRAFASMYGKSRNHSGALREGICESLVLLAVHGNNLFKKSIDVDVQARVNQLVASLLTPLTSVLLDSQQHDLPRYAEAAPDLFLDVIRDDLSSDNPQTLSLLRPASSDVFGGGCVRTGLLWGLECLAWNPDHLPSVMWILARLSEVHIEDNWVNKPENSLKAIFRSWMPQTAAPLEDRKKLLEELTKQFPSVGWRICIDQFDSHSTIGHYSYRPRWRNDAVGAGQPVTRREMYEFARKALDLTLAWNPQNERTLGDLIERLQQMSEADQERVWELIAAWTKTNSPSDEQKATLRERIRQYAFTRRGKRLPTQVRTYASEVRQLLEPSDLIAKYQWLFAKQWVDWSSEELDNEDFNFEKREQSVLKLRTDALKEVWEKLGYEGVLALCIQGESSTVIGRIMTDILGDGKGVIDFVVRLAGETSTPEHAVDSCLMGFMYHPGPEDRRRCLAQVKVRLFGSNVEDGQRFLRVLKCSPLDSITWQFVKVLPDDLQTRYWTEVAPTWHRPSVEELHELIDRMLDVGRPVAAFLAIRFEVKEIRTSHLVRLLREMATKGPGPDKMYRFNSYEITEVFKSLSNRADAPSDGEMAQLEFLYMEALRGNDYGIPHLEKELADSPLLFVQAIAMIYRRDDDGQDPAEWRIADAESVSARATQAYHLLQNAKRIPGTLDSGKVDAQKLVDWIAEVRALCKQHARVTVGDHAIGELLSKSGEDADGVWPIEPVRQALERVGTKEIQVGMSIGLYNQRGAHFRAAGGGAERELAAKYRAMAKKIAIEFPFTARLLREIARTYDRDAEWHDTEDDVRSRLPY